MSGRELDAAVAREVCRLAPCSAWHEMNFGSAGGAALMKSECSHEQGKCYPEIEIGAGINGRIGGPPRYSSDLNACRQAEMELERRGLSPQYCDAFIAQNKFGRLTGVERALFATAEVRCRAMLSAVRGAAHV